MLNEKEGYILTLIWQGWKKADIKNSYGKHIDVTLKDFDKFYNSASRKNNKLKGAKKNV